MAARFQVTPGRRLAFFVGADFLLVAACLLLADVLRFDGRPPEGSWPMYVLDAAGVGTAFVLGAAFVGSYRASWSFVGLRDIGRVALAVAFATVVSIACIVALRGFDVFPTPSLGANIIQAALSFCAVSGFRLSKRAARLLSQGASLPEAVPRALIVGAGPAGAAVVKSIRDSQDVAPLAIVGIVDDDPLAWRTSIHGVRVLGPLQDLEAHLTSTKAEVVIISLPHADRSLVQQVMRTTRRLGISKVRIVPSMSELVGNGASRGTRDVTVEDLLGRDPVDIDLQGVRHALAGRTVLVTGGAGTIGTELCRQIARFGVAKLVVLDVDETRLHDVGLELDDLKTSAKVVQALVDVRDETGLDRLFAEHKIDVVFHAAAYKHVPMMEDWPLSALEVNVLGTWNVLQAAQRHGASRFVLISTDKAVEPSSTMGASKRLAEMALFGSATRGTHVTAVRFGNILGSRGSVIPIFERQLKNGGPITVTHPEVERFFMTTSEAVQLVLQSAVMGGEKDVFVLDMGKPVRIVDVAREFVRLHGLEPDKDIDIVFTGLRPGEKLSESLHYPGEALESTQHPRISKARLLAAPRAEEVVRDVGEVVAERDHDKARAYLNAQFPTLAAYASAAAAAPGR